MGLGHRTARVANSEDVTAHEPADVGLSRLIDDELIDVADHVMDAERTDTERL